MSRNSLREQVREILLQMIGDGRLAPGDRIVETKLAGQLGVSSIPVREAIRELAAMVRSALEPLAAFLGAPRLRTRCGELRREAKAIVAAARKPDFVAFQQHNQAFHRAIFEASGNRVLLRVCDSRTHCRSVRERQHPERRLSAGLP